MEAYTNALIHESSPYLLQHAHNPVDWVPWSEEVFEKAKEENKPVLISVGYSSCHWCHVMEHESFEDEEVATIMNKHFVCIKVDREERPDVDQVYMSAVQLMTQRGGWPLNCFTLPDGRPFYGGTYFPKEQWMHILRSLHHVYTNEPDRVIEYAENLAQGVQRSEVIEAQVSDKEFAEAHLEELVMRWSKSFDLEHGGKSQAPKFPLPNNLEFLLEYALLKGDDKLKKYVEISLDRMAMGGIYDQIGGGFARYSVDMLWKVPHFEKMAYDNGQLLSLYARASAIFEKELYRNVVVETVEWLEREMADASGAFYSALDADSEGVEGKFYTWTEEEMRRELGEDFEWVKEYYCIDKRGFWQEEECYILLRREDDAHFCQRKGWSAAELNQKLKRVKEILLSVRSNRTRPGLDHKCLTAWNAMILQGLCDAYTFLEEEKYLVLAQRLAHWLTRQQLRSDGTLWRSFTNRQSHIDGFLEDYAHTISALIRLYQVSMNESWLHTAKDLCGKSIRLFGDDKTGMFYFTAEQSGLIARKMELSDNVIPASNSVMARNLYYLGHYFRDDRWIERARHMLGNVYDGMEMYGSGYSNWAILLGHEIFGLFEIVALGAAQEHLFQWMKGKAPWSLLAFSESNSSLPIFENRERSPGELRIFVCTLGACLMPVDNVTSALKQVIQ